MKTLQFGVYCAFVEIGYGGGDKLEKICKTDNQSSLIALIATKFLIESHYIKIHETIFTNPQQFLINSTRHFPHIYLFKISHSHSQTTHNIPCN